MEKNMSQATEPNLKTTKEVRREFKPNEYIIPSIPQRLPVNYYHLFNRIIGTIKWTAIKGTNKVDELRTFYEAIYPYIEMVTKDNESLLTDNMSHLRSNAEMICYLKESDQWEKYQEFLKNQSSKKSELS